MMLAGVNAPAPYSICAIIAWNLTSRPSTLRPLRCQVDENAATARNSLDTQALDGEKKILPDALPRIKHIIGRLELSYMGRNLMLYF